MTTYYAQGTRIKMADPIGVECRSCGKRFTVTGADVDRAEKASTHIRCECGGIVRFQ